MKYAKRYMAKIGSAGILLAALAATACMDHGDDIPLIELGAVENSFTVNATAGHVDIQAYSNPVSYTHLRAHETKANIVCRLLLEKKKT